MTLVQKSMATIAAHKLISFIGGCGVVTEKHVCCLFSIVKAIASLWLSQGLLRFSVAMAIKSICKTGH
jgi:hypothetical protein